MLHAQEILENLEFNYMFEFDLADDKSPIKSVKVQTEPGNQADYEAANLAIQSILNSLGTIPRNQSKPNTSGQSLEIAIDDYLGSIGVSAATIRSYRTKLNYLKKYFSGNKDVLSINQMDFVEFSKQAPKDISNSSTSNQYVKVACSFLNWIRIRAGEPSLTTNTLTQKRTLASYKDRDAFTHKQIQTIFENAFKYKETCPAKYWATLSVAFTGARLEEISQINIAKDLKQTDEGIWYLDLNEEPDDDGAHRKSLKRLSSARTVAIHSALVKDGFIEFLKLQLTLGYTRPFESEWAPHFDPKTNELKWNHKISKWGSKELNSLKTHLGMENQKLSYFHSHRHTLITLLASEGVNEEVRSTIAGQQHGGGVNATTYTKLRSNPLISSEILEKHLTSYVKILKEMRKD